MIPVCDLRAQFLAHEAELRAAMERVFARGWFILGEELAAFEQEFAHWIGGGEAIGVASGTDALHLALRAVGVGPGDRVLTAPSSTVPTAAAIVQAGGLPAFADVDPGTGLLDPAAVASHLTPEVKALVPVHLYGRCTPMSDLRALAAARGIPIVEDCAQAHGASHRGEAAGLMGVIGCFSFYPTKNLGAYGDGGACLTNDPELAERLRRLRNYGERARYDSVELGFNSRLDELQAAILRAKLPYLAGWNERRRALAVEYRRRLAGLPLALPPDDPDGVEVVHLFVIRVARRDRLRRELERHGVGSQVHYPVPIHRQPAYAHLGYGPGSFPVAERRAEQIVTLPLYPEMTPETLDRVVTTLEEVLRGEDPPA